MATETNIATGVVFVGEDHTLRFTVTNSGSTAVDITGWAVEFIMSPLDTTAVASATLNYTTSGGEIALTTPTSGVLDVAIADSDTAAITAQRYRYSLRRTDAGLETVLAYGDLFMTPTAAR